VRLLWRSHQVGQGLSQNADGTGHTSTNRRSQLVLRAAFAYELRSRLREHGFTDANAQVYERTLRVSGVGVAPRIAAQQLLGDAKLRRNLIKIGFNTLEIAQKDGLGAEYFSYKIEAK
jgi:hypothetical protein